MIQGQTILVTGGTGSWGQKLTEVLLAQNPAEIRLLSRNEYAQIAMQREFNHDPRLRFIIEIFEITGQWRKRAKA